MNSEDKIKKLKKVTALFDGFMDQLGSVRSNMDKQSLYSEGYAACLRDILEGLEEGKDTEIIKTIKTKIDMDSRKEFLDELKEGISGLHQAYRDILNKE
jgi:hypothetical protein|tara:strand:+ start:458 stop:754 length:297 start_codon:yes stop_codon:yes gene_type:complete